MSQPLMGCSFHERCPFALEKCTSQVPALRVLDHTGRKVACWLHDTPAEVPVALRRRVDEVRIREVASRETGEEAL
ncbi:MAG: hypothetical protein HIU57_04180 [Acidobacteria bacterium]|nr:hypothetical protein [Acidobacteriota bacterium]